MKSKCIKTKQKEKSKTNIKQDQADLVTVILLCDSPGYRMKSYGPLPLVTIDDSKLIDLQIKSIQQAFKNFEIILCVGFDSEKIHKYIRSKYHKLPIRIVENQLFKSSNSCESARLSINNTLNGKVIICDGRLLFNSKTLSLIDMQSTCVLFENYPSDNLEIGVNVDDTNDAQYFSFGASKCWSEILFLHNRDIVEIFRKEASYTDNKNKFVFEILNELLRSKNKIKCIGNNYPVYKISNIKTYHSIKG